MQNSIFPGSLNGLRRTDNTEKLLTLCVIFLKDDNKHGLSGCFGKNFPKTTGFILLKIRGMILSWRWRKNEKQTLDKKLHAYKLFEGQGPSLLTAQNAIRDVLNSEQPVSVTVDKIISEVAKTFGVLPEDIRSKKRNAEIAEARQIAMYILSETTQLTQKSIGSEFSGKDHTTVIYALSRVKELMAKDIHKKRLITDIINNIRGSW